MVKNDLCIWAWIQVWISWWSEVKLESVMVTNLYYYCKSMYILECFVKILYDYGNRIYGDALLHIWNCQIFVDYQPNF